MINSARTAALLGALVLPSLDCNAANDSGGDLSIPEAPAPRVDLFRVPRTHRTLPSEESLRGLEGDALMRESFGLSFKLLLLSTFDKMSKQSDNQTAAWLLEARKELGASVAFAGPRTKAELARVLYAAFGTIEKEQEQIEQEIARARTRVEAAGGIKKLAASERSQIIGRSERLTEASRILLQKHALLKALRDLAGPTPPRPASI